MADRFFATVYARDDEHLRAVFDRHLDVFAPGHGERGKPEIHGLLSIDEIKRLVDDGYHVLLTESDEPREKLATVGFDEWLKDTLADLDERTRGAE